jgi:hypothetical protein
MRIEVKKMRRRESTHRNNKAIDVFEALSVPGEHSEVSVSNNARNRGRTVSPLRKSVHCAKSGEWAHTKCRYIAGGYPVSFQMTSHLNLDLCKDEPDTLCTGK